MRELTLIVDGNPVRCSVERDGVRFVARIGGATHRLRLSPLQPGILRLCSEGRAQVVRLAREGGRTFLHVGGWTLECGVETARPAPAGAAGAHDVTLRAPMPGVVAQVLVRAGEAVGHGQPLAVIEAMKMEHVIRAPRAGEVRALHVHPGDQIDRDAPVCELGTTSDGTP